MRSVIRAGLLALGVVALTPAMSWAQPEGPPPPRREGRPPAGRGQAREDDRRPARGPERDRPGPGQPGRGPALGAVLPPGAVDQLDLTQKQRRELDDLQNEVREKLESILTPEQLRDLRGMMERRPGGPGRGPDGPPPPPRRGGRGPGGFGGPGEDGRRPDGPPPRGGPGGRGPGGHGPGRPDGPPPPPPSED